MNLNLLVKKVINKISIRKNKILYRSIFKKKVSELMSSNYIDLLNFSYFRKISKTDKILGNQIEDLRKDVSEKYKDTNVSTFASPRSGSKLYSEDGSVIPGQFLESSKAGFAKTGTDIVNGIQLKKIVESMRANSIIELGTNTGLSGCYFLSAKNNPFLYTVEGSSELCEIANINLSTINKNFFVDNSLFDDAIDSLAKENQIFDLAFVDGQHEEKATIHYAQKLKNIIRKGGGIIFDDIYWSEGMNNAWLEIMKDNDFSLTMDLGTRGLCILRDKENLKKKSHFSVTKFIGKPLLYREGW